MKRYRIIHILDVYINSCIEDDLKKIWKFMRQQKLLWLKDIYNEKEPSLNYRAELRIYSLANKGMH